MEERQKYPVKNLCDGCVAAIKPNAQEGACLFSDKADGVLEKVQSPKKSDRIDATTAKNQISKLSQEAFRRKCALIQTVRLRVFPQTNPDQRYLTRGHALERVNTDKPKQK